MLKFKTSCAVLAYLSSNLLNEVGLSLFRYFEVGRLLRVCDIVVKKFTFAISSPDEFLLTIYHSWRYSQGIIPSEGAKMTNFRLRGCIPVSSWHMVTGCQRSLFIDCGCAVIRFCPNMSLQQVGSGPRLHARKYLYMYLWSTLTLWLHLVEYSTCAMSS